MMANECRVVVIDEENEDLLISKSVDEELADQIVGIVEDGEIDNYEECEQVCSQVVRMLEDIGINCDGDHDKIMKELKSTVLIKKEVVSKVRKIKRKK